MRNAIKKKTTNKYIRNVFSIRLEEISWIVKNHGATAKA